MRGGLAASVRRLSVSFLLICLCVTAYYTAFRDAGAVRSVYTPFSRAADAALSRLFSAFPFSAAEFLLYILLAALLFYTVYTLVMLAIRPRRPMRLLVFLSRLILWASVLVFLFSALWGVNYLAPPLSETLGLGISSRPSGELFETAEALLEKTNEYARKVPRDENSVAVLGDFSSLAGRVGEGYRALAGNYPFYRSGDGAFSAPKAVAAWKLMSFAGISGIYTPFTGEANVNPSTPQACLPFTMAHEVAHRLGVAPENEANFSAFLSCISSPDDAYVYSGYFEGFLYCYDAVALVDGGEQAKLWNGLNEYAMADLLDMIAYNKRYEGPAREAGTRLNDAYLKTMLQEEGVRSYGEVTDLIIAWYMESR